MAIRARTQRARRLRRDATDVEKLLWRALREQLPQFGFRRQHPIGPFVVDFACASLKLEIELDGGQHAMQRREDSSRTVELALHGYRVIRFWNDDVMNNLPGVLETIGRELEARAE